MCPSVLFKNEEAISQSKILVVDDNAEIRKLLVLHLKASGYDTAEAATGLEALKQARATSPDLIILDLAMPDGNGDEVIASLKSISIDARYTCHCTHSFPARTASESCYRRRGGRNTL